VFIAELLQRTRFCASPRALGKEQTALISRGDDFYQFTN
jgi:hypothetical protein